MITRTWLFVVAGVAIANFAGGWIVNGWRHNAAERAAVEAAIAKTRSQYERRDADFRRAQEHDQVVTAENARLRQQLVAQAVALEDAVRGVPLVESSKVTRNEDGACECSDARRGTAYRVCTNAAISGTSEAVAACAAHRGHAAVRRE
jgi:hypothetical protein